MHHTRLLRLIWGAGAVLTLALLWIAGRLVWREFAGPSDRVRRLQRHDDRRAARETAARPGRDDYALTWRLPIVPDMQPAANDAGGAAVRPALTLEELAALLRVQYELPLCSPHYGDPAGKSYASVLPRGQYATRVVKIGDILDGRRVVAITAEAIEFEQDGVRARLAHTSKGTGQFGGRR